MADEKDEKSTIEDEPQKETVKVEPEKIESVDELKAMIEKLNRTVTNKEQEAERVHKKLEKFEKEEEQRKLAELSEIDKLKLEAETAKKEAAELKLNLKRREIAAKFDLPEILTDRIKGETPEEMEADAKRLVDELPKHKQVKVNETNPGGGTGREGETREQRMERLH